VTDGGAGREQSFVTERVDIDALALAQELIRCESVTPRDEGALDILEHTLAGLGFTCHRLRFTSEGEAGVHNLYARLGSAVPNFCYAGHTDVVPIGERDAWSQDPFAGEIVDDALYGRGAADMKGAIACFIAAVSQFLAAHSGEMQGSISLLITGDEEGLAVNGTVKVLGWMREKGEVIDHCLVGEPTNPRELGEMVKIGRRGSLNAELAVTGTQGHVAYPDLADNPIPRLLAMLTALTAESLDKGNDHFQASNLEITSVDVGNQATNLIPATVRARFNVRFNDEHNSEGVIRWLRRKLDGVGDAYELTVAVSGEAFVSPPGPFTHLVVEAIKATIGIEPELSTSGGTSDARFIKDACPVAEFGLISQTMHKVDEHTRLADLQALTRVYRAVLEGYFAP
jgi:succinyl-diaminopimelate desuccinylase